MASYVISVVVGNNACSHKKSVKSTDTPRKTLNDCNIDCAYGLTILDGSTLTYEELNKTYEQLGIKNACYLFNIIKPFIKYLKNGNIEISQEVLDIILGLVPHGTQDLVDFVYGIKEGKLDSDKLRKFYKAYVEDWK